MDPDSDAPHLLVDIRDGIAVLTLMCRRRAGMKASAASRWPSPTAKPCSRRRARSASP